MTVREMLGRLDSRELTEWIVYYELEPWGEERADLRQAFTSAILVNANLAQNAEPAKPEDFMPYTEKQPEEPTGLTGAPGAALAKHMFGETKQKEKK